MYQYGMGGPFPFSCISVFIVQCVGVSEDEKEKIPIVITNTQ